MHEGADLTSRINRLIRLSEELEDLSEQVQKCADGHSKIPTGLLERNREIVLRCNQLAAEFSAS